MVTNPTNLYSQQDFRSRDVVLTFHIRLALHLQYVHEREVSVAPGSAELLPGSWRRWQQVFDVYDSGYEAETFQAVGVRLRECLASFLDETTGDELVPEGTQRPKQADFRAWTDLLANTLAVDIQHVIADAGYVAVHTRIATGQAAQVATVVLYRIQDGLVAELLERRPAGPERAANPHGML